MKVYPPITFNKVILHPKRLRMISFLANEHKYVAFQDIKQLLELTDGNLASHLRQLQKHKIIQIEKRFVGKIPQTRIKLSDNGFCNFDTFKHWILELLEVSNRE